ncbi:MAG TPA: sigma 54-interacting transcriptional regulator [Polyangiaceae bacterium]|nr:sigma 54-interacting transcriptional regulator [Polyangiaceae bacterium]
MIRPTDDRSPGGTTEAPPAPESGPYVLTIHAPGRPPRSMTLEPGKEYSVGRRKSASIVLDHAWVSERHAVITAADPPYIVDVGSRNATFVDGHRLVVDAPKPLPSGSVVSIGGFSMLITRAEHPETSAVMRCAQPVQLPSEPPPTTQPPDLGESAPVVRDQRMRELYTFAQQIARSSVSVLIMGETGSGKELMAQAIHRQSPRRRRALVSLNCATIPETLVESELFGYERGAFSGAVAAKRGLFEEANGTTFFLDEIGELPASVQAKLLRVLETGEVLRLGAVRPVHVDVRIVAATNRDLATQVKKGSFRADLFYRLNGLTISIPPLRERPDDVEDLARHFAQKAGEGHVEFSTAALDALRDYRWPGNVRELKSVIERALLISEGGVIEVGALNLQRSTTPPEAPPPESLAKPEATEIEQTERFSADELPTSVFRAELDRREQRRIREALERTAGNQTEAARLLNISRRTLMKRMDRFGMSRPRKGSSRGGDE